MAAARGPRGGTHRMSYEVAEVLSGQPTRTWESQNGPVHYFPVKLTDGTMAEAGKKSADTPPKVGDRYKTLRQPSKPDYLATLQGPITDFQGGGGKSHEADPKGLRSRNASTAISYAKD